MKARVNSSPGGLFADRGRLHREVSQKGRMPALAIHRVAVRIMLAAAASAAACSLALVPARAQTQTAGPQAPAASTGGPATIAGHATPNAATLNAADLVREGLRHEHAEGVPRDTARAASLFCAAARMGDAQGAYQLAWMHATGRGVPRDDALAVGLLQLAARRGHALSAGLLQKVKAPVARLPACLEEGNAAAVTATAPPATPAPAQASIPTSTSTAAPVPAPVPAPVMAMSSPVVTGASGPVSAAPAAPAAPARPVAPTATTGDAIPTVRHAAAPGAPPGEARPSVPPAPVPGADPLRAQVAQAVEQWARAWSARDVPAYLAAYAADYALPPGQSRAQWEAQRRLRIEEKARIEVAVTGLEIRPAGVDAAEARFRQRYRSDSYNEDGIKVLSLVRAGNRWLIRAERATR